MKIVDSAKQFIKEHKPETVAVAIVAGTAVVLLAVKYTQRNSIKFTDEFVDAMSDGGYVHFMMRGKEYVTALYEHKPE